MVNFLEGSENTNEKRTQYSGCEPRDPAPAEGKGRLSGCNRPSAVDESVTEDVPVPPEASTVLAAEAEMARDASMQMARMREMIFLVFFMVKSPHWRICRL